MITSLVNIDGENRYLQIPDVTVSAGHNVEDDWAEITARLANIHAAKRLSAHIQNTATALYQAANETTETPDLSSPENAKWLEAAVTVSDSLVQSRATEIAAAATGVKE